MLWDPCSYPVKIHSQPSILHQVDSWIDFCAHEIELPATIWCYPVIGYMPYNDAAVSKAKEDLKTALGALEKALLEKTYLVSNSCAVFSGAVCRCIPSSGRQESFVLD